MRVSLKAPRHRLTFQSFLNQELDQHIEVTACLLLGTMVCLYIGPLITRASLTRMSQIEGGSLL
jgi:hypothetical protein